MNDIESVLYRDALLALARAARAFAQAAATAAERSTRADGDDALAAAVAIECSAALWQALMAAPGLIQLFVGGNPNGVAADTADDLSPGRSSGDQSE